MEYPSKKQKISRVDLRYRPSISQPRDKKPIERSKRKPLKRRLEDEPLLIREMKGREVMGHGHRALHHRQPSGVATVIVEVVNTVDANGSLLAVQTVPAVPSVPAFPSDLTVPAVPQVTSVAFPSVPAYPFPSGVNAGSVPGVVPSSQTSLSLASTISGSETLTASSLLPTSFPSTFGRNSTISSTSSNTSSSFSSTLNSTSLSSTSSSRTSSSSSLSSSSSISSSSQLTSSSIASSTDGGGFGGGMGATATANSSPTASSASGSHSSGDGNSITTPQVVGSVLGSLAGLALILIVALLLLKRYKRKRQGALQLPDNDTIASNAQQPPMTQSRNAPGSSFVPAGAAALFSRLSTSSKGTSTLAPTSPNQERGFQRISGRKLPSAFSEGMTSEQFERDRASGTLSGSSWYRDSQGTYGGTGAAAGAVGKETMMPSPARTPVIHHPGDEKPSNPFDGAFNKETGGSSGAAAGGAFDKETLSPPRTPRGGPPAGASNLSPPGTPQSHSHVPRGTLGRSHPSQDGSRGSRFTEDV